MSQSLEMDGWIDRIIVKLNHGNLMCLNFLGCSFFILPILSSQVIQKRFDGSTNFYRPWIEYKMGFGSPAGEYWLGEAC